MSTGPFILNGDGQSGSSIFCVHFVCRDCHRRAYDRRNGAILSTTTGNSGGSRQTKTFDSRHDCWCRYFGAPHCALEGKLHKRLNQRTEVWRVMTVWDRQKWSINGPSVDKILKIRTQTAEIKTNVTLKWIMQTFDIKKNPTHHFWMIHVKNSWMFF